MAANLELIITATDKASGTLKGIDDKAGGLGSSLRRVGEIASGFVVGNAFSAAAAEVTNFVGGSVTAAKDLGESLNAVNVVFGESSAKVLDWGKNNATAFGLSSREFNQLVTPLGAMLQNYGFSADEAAGQSIELAKRAADMASVFNTDVGTALEAIQAGLRGEADPLEKFGVGLNAAAIEQKALAMTGKDAAKSLTDQEKKAASLALIMEQTASVQGDFANTSDSLANAQRIAAAKTEELQAKLGTKLMPVTLFITQAKLKLAEVLIDKVVPAIEDMAVVFERDVLPVLEEIGREVLPVLEDAFAQLQQLAKGLVPILKDVAEFFMENKVALGVLIVAVGLLLAALFPVPAAIIGLIAVGTLLLAHWDDIRNKVTELVQDFQDKFPLLTVVIETVFGFVKNRVEFYINLVKAIIKTVTALIRGDWDEAWQGIKDSFNAFWGLIKADVETAIGGIEGIIRGVIPAAKGAAEDLWRKIEGAFRSGVNGVISVINDFIRAINSLPDINIDAGPLGSINIGVPTIGTISPIAGPGGSFGGNQVPSDAKDIFGSRVVNVNFNSTVPAGPAEMQRAAITIREILRS